MFENMFHGARVFLVDDHPAVRLGLSLFLVQKGIIISGEAENKEETLQRLAEARPDLVLLDLSLEIESCFDLVEELHARGVRLLVYSMFDDSQNIERAFKAGAHGYVAKREKTATLLDAIRDVLAGRCFLSPVVAQVLANRQISGSPRIQVHHLRGRQLEIFQLLGKGYCTSDIASIFQLSTNTIETYYARIIKKMGFDGAKDMRRQAVQYVKMV